MLSATAGGSGLLHDSSPQLPGARVAAAAGKQTPPEAPRLARTHGAGSPALRLHPQNIPVVPITVTQSAPYHAQTSKCQQTVPLPCLQPWQQAPPPCELSSSPPPHPPHPSNQLPQLKPEPTHL
ncbi:hypothetical protein MJG53_002489 [Ovis ammon polii x Ovis aries]|uniref:Uncharacterized protein n=1 Tax=Ovis ammon polii x Ovis aries TaxID=2918886 RepID=A0ACB9VF34_9CETA|nr:hypothetical protein MJG53_002489 [Ovis ammon polii x Ovis aries]